MKEEFITRVALRRLTADLEALEDDDLLVDDLQRLTRADRVERRGARAASGVVARLRPRADDGALAAHRQGAFGRRARALAGRLRTVVQACSPSGGCWASAR